MNKRNALGILACAASAAIAAGNVSNGLYWNGANDTDARVYTGSDDLTSGYWYTYSDDVDGGSSRFIFPADVESNTYGNFFGPLVEAYGGIKARVSLGDGYDYPYAGLGFNIWSENQEGVDISSWGGLVIGYESSLGFVATISVEDEHMVTGYDNYRARVPKAPNGNLVEIPWSKFKQDGWGISVDRNYVLSRAAAIKLQFEGVAGTSGDFRITSIRSIQGVPDTTHAQDTTVIPPVSQFTSDTLFWDGASDDIGRVSTGSDDLTSGYWFDFTDADDAGTSTITYPSDVQENTYGNFFGPLVEAYGGVKAHVSLGDGYDYPYAGVGFNIWSENQEGVNVTSWGGIALEYESTIGFALELVTDNERELEYDNYKVSVPKSPTVREIILPWSKFKQGNWGAKYDRAAAIARVATIRARFEGTAGTAGDFRITKIRSIGASYVDTTIVPPDTTVVPPPDTVVVPPIIPPVIPPVIPPASNLVSSELRWDGSTDTEGQVFTGSDEWTAGYWYEYNDENDGGTSKLIYPSDVEENVWGNFFGPLVEAYGGVKAHVSLGDGYDYPYVGIGFNIWSEDQEGVDVTSWGGIVLEYESTGPFTVQIVTDFEKAMGYDNYKAYVPKSPAVRQIELPWSAFKQGGWGETFDKDAVLKRIAAIRIQFEGTAGTEADFRITKIRSITSGSGTVVPPTPVVTEFVSKSLFWDGANDDIGRVSTGSDTKTYGYWYEETDADEHGRSKFVWPSNVHEDVWGNFFGPLVQAYKGVKGRVMLKHGARHPYASVGFNIWSEDQEGVDVSAWGGLVIEYESTIDFSVELVTDGNKKAPYYGTYVASAPKSRHHVRQLVIPWSKFKRSTGWGLAVNKTSALKHIAAIKFKFEGRAGTVGDFRITKIRSINSGYAVTINKPEVFQVAAVEPVSRPATDAKVILSGRTLSFEGVTAGKAQVVNLRGQVVKSFDIGASADLSNLDAGAYMVRIAGHGVSLTKKIVLK